MKREPTTINFGKKLANLRKSKGLTQQQLGDKIGVSKRVIAYYEGETKYPPAHLIVPLSKALSITADELLGIKKTRYKECCFFWRFRIKDAVFLFFRPVPKCDCSSWHNEIT